MSLLPAPSSLRLRILLVALAPMGLALGGFVAYFAHHVISEAEQNLEVQGAGSAAHLADAVAHDLFSGNLVNVKRLLDFERSTRKVPAIGIAADGRWLLISGDTALLPDLARQPPAARWQQGERLIFVHPVRHGEEGASDPHPDPAQAVQGQPYAVVALDRRQLASARSEIFRTAAVAVAASLVLAVILAWRLAVAVSRPIRQLTVTVMNLAGGELEQRVPEASPGEIGRLERGVNRMAQALARHQGTLEQRVEAATAELLAQKAAAEAAVLAKSRFLASASHDLRQPLHALTLLVAALRERLQDDESRRLAAHIEASAAAMGSLLNALLELSRLDAGVVQAHPVCFPLDKVMRNVTQQFAPLAQERRLNLVLHPTGLWAVSDPVLVERILTNLVANALRYTERGKVLIGARRLGRERLRIQVWDTGKGIPEAFQNHIFEAYFQLDNPERQREKGLGLGLAIVAKLAHLLGGEVSVRSQPGRGSCFGITLERCPPALHAARLPAPAAPGFTLPLENALVAFVDDDETIMGATVELFDHWGVALAAGTDADQVCAELEALGRKPDIILCDYRLRGGKTGVEAIRTLRQAFGHNIPAALLTGDTAPATIQALAGGQFAVLHKPLKPAKLRAFLSHLLASGADRSAR